MADKYDNARRRGMRGGADRFGTGAPYHYNGPEPETTRLCPICSQRLPNHRTMCPRAAVHMVWSRDSGAGHEDQGVAA